MKKLSLKIKLTLIMALITLAVVVIFCVLNSTLFEKYYMRDRQRRIVNSYNKIKELVVENGIDDESVTTAMTNINALHNINIFIVDSNWNVSASTKNNILDTKRWLIDFVFGDNSDKTVLEKDDYIIKQGVDSISGLNYLSLYGMLSDGTQIIMQINLESIEENISIFNHFIQIIGIGVMCVGIICVYIISSKFTKPIKKLSNVAEEMSKMNFDVKYTGKEGDEIGILGNSMNVMSDSLKDNITKLKNANYELKMDLQMKTEAVQRQKEFLGSVSHELKTPIALIQGYAEGLKEGVADDKESLDYYCDVIVDEASKMNNLVKRLLSLDEIENGNKGVNIERFDLNSLIKSVIKANSLAINQRNIDCKYTDNGSIFVWYDELQIEEVITNFLTNAIHYSDSTIDISVQKNEKSVTVTVYNSGDNIPENDIDHIWDKFYKVDKARTREYGGNGIGLSIVKAILDNYGVKYGVQNKDHGVAFWLILECE